MELPSSDVIAALLRKHCDALGLDSVGEVKVSLIGQGEANLNVLTRVNQAQDFNLRIGLRGDESDRTLQSEYAVLQIVPNGVGPSAFLVDFSRTALPQPYMVLEYLAGGLKKAWELEDLQAYARALAHLHQRKFEKHGALDALSDAPYDFVYRFDTALNYWRTHHRYLLDIPIIQRLLPPIRHFVVDNASLFTDLRHFAIVHGDAHPLNILFHEGRVYFIDWEQATIGDPACDVTNVGWDIATAWQMELTGERLESFLDTYLALEPDETLRQRRQVWMVYTMLFGHMYNRTQLANDPTGKHLDAVQRIEGYLTNRFL